MIRTLIFTLKRSADECVRVRVLVCEQLIKSLCCGSICRRLVVMAAVPVRRTSVLDLPRVLLPAVDVLLNIWCRCAACVLCGHKVFNESHQQEC